MKLKEIARIIENFANPQIAEDYDNIGLLIGDREKGIKKVLITLDTNLCTVNEAIENGCDMILSHHPIFFRGIKKIDYSTAEGQMVKNIIKNDISLFAAHTNIDSAKGGINDVLADIFGIENCRVLEPSLINPDEGLGRYGKLKNPVAFGELCDITREKLSTPIRAAGDFNKEIKTLCVAGGSCSEFIGDAIRKGCDAVITGDLKYHDMMSYSEDGICIIDAGHYPTEIIVLDIFEKLLSGTGVEVVKSKNTDVFKFV